MSKSKLSLIIGERIRSYRLNAGLTLEKLAEKVGSTSNYIGILKRCEKNALIVTLDQITSALGISLSAFFLNISSSNNDPLAELNKAYNLLLTLPPDKRKFACAINDKISKNDGTIDSNLYLLFRYFYELFYKFSSNFWFF